MKFSAGRQALSIYFCKTLFSLCIFFQFGMNSASGHALFILNPHLGEAELEKIKAAARKTSVQADEIEPVLIRSDLSVMNLDFISFPVPHGPTYLFHKRKTIVQGGKFGWFGDTQDHKVRASFITLADGSLSANVFVDGPLDTSRTESHYSARTSATGLGFLRKLSLTSPNFPRHTPGTKRNRHTRSPASCQAAATTKSDGEAADVPLEVLVLYTEAAAQTDGVRLVSDVRTAIDHCNAGIANSKVPNLIFKLVGPPVAGTAIGPQSVDYLEEGSIEAALDWLDADDNENVKQLRNLYGADVVVLVVGDELIDCGLSNSYAHPEKAFAVVYAGQGCLTRKYYSMAHEIGHIIGMDHDKDT